jgi:glycosyltransferase involved in cell wall biosynthesis
MRAVFVYPNPRGPFAAQVAQGNAPDSTLLGQNHLHEHGIDAVIHDPPLAGGSRPTWILREAIAAYGLPTADVLVSGLANVLPLTARTRSLAVVVVNYGLNSVFRRASPPRRRLLATSLRSAAAIVSFGHGQSDDLGAFVDARKLAPVPFGIDAEWWRRAPDAVVDPELVLTVGKDLARDYATFATAMAGLDARALVVALPRNLQGISLPKNTRAAWIPLEELRDSYARAACVVIPQQATAFHYGADGGLTALLEAMAMSRPVVATDRPTIREYVEDGVEALLVPPGDAAALRDAVERVVGNPELARALGEAGRARIEREFTSHQFAGRLANVLHSVT